MLELNCNAGRMALCTIVGFAFIAVLSYFVHGTLLLDMYQLTPDVWRSMADTESFLPFSLFIQFLLALVTAYTFTQNYEDGGVSEGLRFGLLLGVLLAVLWSMPYVYLPISASLATAWAMNGIIMGLGLGIIYAILYRD